MIETGPRIVRTRRGARLLQAGTVVSEVRAEPGPTHTLFDVLAATVAGLAPGRRVAVLGFAAGGLIAPLRAMGFTHRIDAVDLSADSAQVFWELSSRWAGDVRLEHEDAARWLARRRSRYDLILEDLFLPGRGGMEKPEVSWRILPGLVRRHLAPRGVAVVNTLPVRGMAWREVAQKLAAPFPRAHAVLVEEYDNRLVVAGRSLGSAREVSARLRGALAAIGSRQASRISVLSLTTSRR